MSTIQVNLMADSQGGSVAPISSVMRNRLINAGFTINQRVYVSGTALSAGTYAHDRFKAGASGCTYTFTQGSAGVPIVITITAGSLQQVIEGANMSDGGTYVLSWTGTAQAKFNGGSFGASPLAVTGIVAGANTTIEFGTGTCSFPQLEKGTQATGFEYRQIGTELALCQRYFQSIGNQTATGLQESATTISVLVTFYNTMRASPTCTIISGISCAIRNGSGDSTATTPVLQNTTASTQAIWTNIAGFSGLTVNAPCVSRQTQPNFIAASAEL